MNGAQLHLALNHLPVVTSWITLGLLLWGTLAKNIEIKKVGWTLAVLTAVFAAAAFWTGEPAEHVLKAALPNFPRDLVHEHEEAGEAAFIVAIIAGIGGLGSLFFLKSKPKFSFYFSILTLVTTLMIGIAFIRTAHLGGLIQHPEIRPQTSDSSAN